LAKPHPPKPRLVLRVGISGHRPNRLAAMSRLVEETASALTADLSDWRLLYRGKPLTLAG
jgi:hypothetical protein